MHIVSETTQQMSVKFGIKGVYTVSYQNRMFVCSEISVLEWTLKEQSVKLWSEFVWLRLGSSCGLL